MGNNRISMIGTQPGLSEIKLQSEIMVAASQLLIEYAYDNYRGTVDEAGVQSMLIRLSHTGTKY